MESKYSIYFVATPIGNLEDMTLRAINVLKNVDVIACEDTRDSMKLLNHFEIKNKLISYHKFNEEKRSEEIIEKAKEGVTFAIITDQGMPGISDPGHILIKRCQENNISYTVLPGASSIITALVASGLANDRFSYYGFVPKKAKNIEILMKELEKEEKTSILLDTPYKLKNTISYMKKYFPKRKLSIARELTKLYEEIKTFTIEDITDDVITLKGEFVLILEGAQITKKDSLDNYKDEIKEELENGSSTKDIVKSIRKKTDFSKNEIYNYVLEIQNKNL
ncbi:MAG: 16S rRNA (cytidine(1402)-2'-O)-methyltransferase [Tissierellia bacterium]|nr:16S rRNA (cytidine(1402)-2'-O)-methyltransferase [Tissierellia bacterium]